MLAVLGVGVTVGGIGDVRHRDRRRLALLMTVALSLMTVLARDRALPVLRSAFCSALLAALAVLPPGLHSGTGFAIAMPDALWLAAFGIVSMAIALPCYLAGVADVPAGRAMLISAVEMPLAPLWIWLAFGDVPTATSILGGSIVACAIIFDLAGHKGSG